MSFSTFGGRFDSVNLEFGPLADVFADVAAALPDVGERLFGPAAVDFILLDLVLRILYTYSIFFWDVSV